MIFEEFSPFNEMEDKLEYSKGITSRRGGRGGILLSGLSPSHLCAYSKPGLGFARSYVVFLLGCSVR